MYFWTWNMHRSVSCKYFIKIIYFIFACSIFMKRTIVFSELFFHTRTQWHPSISFGDTATLISFNISTTFSSRFWLGTSSGIPVFSTLLRGPYYSSELCSLSKVKILFSRTFTFFLRRSFSTWSFLMITSFKFNSSLSRPSNLEVIFFSRFMIKVAVSNNWEVLAFVWDGASTIVSFEVLTSVGVLFQLN